MSLALSGCATYSTISNAGPNTPKVFSGTRLNAAALSGDDYELRRFRVSPPPYPLLDLPFSFVADMFVSPLTFPTAFSEAVFSPLW